MKTTRNEVRPWICWILALAALLVASPREAHAATFNANVGLSVRFSLDSTCNEADPQTMIVAPGTQIWICHKVTNQGSITLSQVTVVDTLAPYTGNKRTLPVGGSSFFVSAAPITATATTLFSFTATGANAAGDTFVAGPAIGTLTVNTPGTFIPVLPHKIFFSTDATCGNADDQSPLTVTAGTLVYFCYRVENHPVNGITLYNVQVHDTLITVPGTRTLPPGAVTYYKAGPIVATVDEHHAFTTTGNNAAGDTFLRGPDYGDLFVVTPSLAVTKTVSLDGTCPGVELVTVLAGTQVTYCYTVTNSGGVNVNAITLNDSSIALPVGNLSIGQSWTGSAPFTASSDTTTQAIATGVETISGGTVVSPPDDATVNVILPALSISVTVSTSGQCPGDEVVNVLAGSAVTWCYTVTNTGDSDVDNILVTDNQYGQVPGSITSLLPGDSATLSLNVSASDDVTLLASAAGTVPVTGTPVVSPQDPAVVNVVRPQVDVDITVSTNGQCPGLDSVTVVAGTDVIYCYTVFNNGDDTLAEVKVYDQNNVLLTTLENLDPGTGFAFSSAPITVLGDQLPTATANGTDIYGYPVTDTDTAIVHPLFDRLAVQKTVSLDGSCPGSELVTVLAGTTVTYCYLVTNPGDTTLEGVIVNDNGIFVDVGNLVPGQSVSVSAGYVALTDQNTDAVAEGTNNSTGGQVTSLPDNAAVDVVAPTLVIEKTVSLDGTCPGSELVVVLTGTTVTYCYAVTNTGDTTIGDISVDDNGAHTAVGTLGPGQSTTVSATIVSTSEDVSTAAVAKGTDTATWTAVASQPDDAAIDVIHPALSISTTVSLDGTCPGDEVVNVLAGTAVTWCYVVTNTGDVAVNGVTGYDDIYGVVSGGGVTLEVGGSTTFTRAAAPESDVGIIAFAAGTDAALGSAVESNEDPAVVNVVRPNIDIDVTVSSNGTCPGVDALTVPAGTNVTYCYTVSNLGDDTLVNIVVTDGNGHVVATIPTLESGGSTTITGATAPASTDAAPSATADATDQYGFTVHDNDAAVVHVLFANLKIVKTAPSQVSASSGGTAIAYTLVVTNIGQTAAVGSVVTDALPAGSSFVGATTAAGTCSFASGTVTCQIGSVAVGASITITVNTTTSLLSGSVTNTALVSSVTPDSDLSDNSSSATTSIATGGATRTIGFYSNHPTFTEACLNARGGVFNIGFMTIRNETADNQVDGLHGPDKDNRKETAIAMVMGVLNANIDHYRDDTKRTALESRRMQAAKQMIAAICNAQYLGTPAPFDLNAALVTLAGTNIAAINIVEQKADQFNNSGDVNGLPGGIKPGPANSKYPWDDPTDIND